jgi:hypothetical protein
MCFVIGKALVPLCWGFGIERHCDMSWALFVDHFQKGIGKPEHGGCVKAFGVNARTFAEGEIGAIDERHAVEQEQFLII